MQQRNVPRISSVWHRLRFLPDLLEAYRECLRDVSTSLARRHPAADRNARAEGRDGDPRSPSPFASALLFTYVANYLYSGDAPLAERRAQALAIDQAQLRELLGDAELRELLDADALAEVEAQAQQLDPAYHAKSVDGVHDMLLRLGDLTRDEIGLRSRVDAGAALKELLAARRAIIVNIGGQARVLPVEYAGRYRDALGVPLPQGLPERYCSLPRMPLTSRDATRGRTVLSDGRLRGSLRARPRRGACALEGALRRRPAPGRRIPPRRVWTRVVRSRHPAVGPSPLAREVAPQVEPVEPQVFVRL